MRIDLAEMHRAADRVAARTEAALAAEQDALAAEIEFAKANKQAVTGSYWKAAHVAGLKARAARAVADAIAEVMSDA